MEITIIYKIKKQTMLKYLTNAISVNPNYTEEEITELLNKFIDYKGTEYKQLRLIKKYESRAKKMSVCQDSVFSYTHILGPDILASLIKYIYIKNQDSFEKAFKHSEDTTKRIVIKIITSYFKKGRDFVEGLLKEAESLEISVPKLYKICAFLFPEDFIDYHELVLKKTMSTLN